MIGSAGRIEMMRWWKTKGKGVKVNEYSKKIGLESRSENVEIPFE